MFNFYLPLAQEFEKVVQEHDIENWEVKKFYSKFDSVKVSSCNSEKYRRTVYIGIKILLRRGYLSVKGSPTHSKKFGGVSKSMLTLNEAIIDVKKG